MAAVLSATLLAPAALAQSACASDGQPAPTALLERFLNADCEACWADAAGGEPPEGSLALDWITPGSRGEDAPLSAAALRDSQWRLQALGQATPARAARWGQPVAALPGLQLRVAHGGALNGYVGASITLTLRPALARQAWQQDWTVWLALVETIPAGTEGTPLARRLVRNTHQPRWNWAEAEATAPAPAPASAATQAGDAASASFSDSRILSLPGGTQAERLGVVGWVQDSQGRVLAAAQSRCVPAD